MIPQRRMLESQPMRGFRAGLAVFVCAVAALVISVGAQPPQYDLVLRNGRIVDGTGSPWFKGDVAIGGDTIVRIAPRDRTAGRAGNRRRRRGRGAGVHRHPHARPSWPARRAHRAELRTAGRHHGDGRTRRIVTAADRDLSDAARAPRQIAQHRYIRRAGVGSRRRHRARQSGCHATGTPEDGRPRRTGNEGRCVRSQHRSLLRARDLHADRRSRRARARRRTFRRHARVRISATMRRRCSTA